MARPARLRSRLGPFLMAAMLATLSFAFTSAPDFGPADPRPASAPLPVALRPQPAAALYCATPNPTFTGYLTQTLQDTGTPPAVSRITNRNVYGWISNIDDDWACTLYSRYDGLGWVETLPDEGTFNWGLLVHSNSSSCNWIIGTTDYLKASPDTTCNGTDTTNAMQISLEKDALGTRQEGVYQEDAAHDSVGDFFYIHSDCDVGAFYGTNGESIRYNATFSGASSANRPGVNCDVLTYDSMGSSQTVVYDETAPSIGLDSPVGSATQSGPAVTVQFDATDNVAGFAAPNDWELQRRIATLTAGACGSFSNDSAPGSLITGETSALDQTSFQVGLLNGRCYQWTLAATDQNGNAATTLTSGTVLRDTSANLGQQRQHTFESWDLGAGDSLAVNVATGNLVLSHPIVSLPIRVSTTSMSLTYNRQDSSNVGMGPGWRLNVFRRLTVNADNSVTFVDADDARYTYTNPIVNGTVTTYTRPAALYATLVKDTAQSANEFVLTYRDQSKDKFDILGSEGILVRAEDRFANGVTLTYVAGTNRISQILDTATSPNRAIDLAWDGSNRLTTITDWAWIDSAGVVQTSATGAQRTYRFFYDGSSNLAGWSDPLNTAGSCPTAAPHLTCVTYPTDELDVARMQTVEGAGATALTTSSRTITTKVMFAGSDVTSVTDAQQVFAGGPGTAFGWVSPTRVDVSRPTTSAGYGLVGQNDVYARIASVWRPYLEGSTEIERRTTWDATYPTEPATVTDNYGGQLGTPARTVSDTYVASSFGLLMKHVEPLTGTTNRWTEYVYNANNDVTQKTVSLDGSATKTVTRSCYSTQSLTCPTSEAGLTLVRRIDNWVSAGPQNNDTNVATDYTYDAYGRQIRITRRNRDAAGAVRDDRVDALVFDAANQGNLVSEIRNYVDGVVTNGTSDTNPGADSVRTDLTTSYTYDTAGNRVSSADPRRAIGLAIPSTTTATFSPSDDAHVRDANPTTNYGTDPTLQVSATGGTGGAYEPYLKFTVTGLIGTVTNATLRLQNTGGGGGAPSQRVTSATVTGTGAVTVAPAAGHVAGDVELLFVETANEAATLTTAAGFAQVPGTGVGIGVGGGTDGARMTVFWRRWNGTDGSPTVADSGNHQSAFISSYQGVVSSGNPWDVVGSNQQTPATTAGSAAGVTTGLANTLVVVATAGAQPDATSTTEFGAWTNANLTSLTERHDETVTTGNGGAIAVTDGLKASAGATGATTFTSVTSTTKDTVVIALKSGVCASRVPDTTWTEAAVTWTTKPASDASPIACIGGDQAAGSIDYNLGLAVPGPGLWAFRLTNSATSALIYAAKEDATLADPALILTLSYGPLATDDFVTRWTYDALNARLSEKTPTTYGVSVAQKTSSSIYDELGGVREAVDFGGVATGTEFDRDGRATKTFEDVDGSGSAVPATTSITTYDADGHALTSKDRNQVGNSALGYTNNTFDSLGRQTVGTDAYASSPDVASDTLTSYDALDRRTLLTVGGQDTAYTYDLGGRTLSTDDDFACTTQTYDYRDLALTVRDGLAGGTCAAAANTRTVTTSYDGLGRSFRAEVTEGTGLGDRTSDLTLDSAGMTLSSASKKAGVTTTTTFTVTTLDQSIAEGRPDGSTVKTTFDAAGNPSDRCYWKPGISVDDCKVVGTTGWTNPPSQSTSTTFDARNSRIQQVDGLTNAVTTYDPDHNYQPKAVYLPTGSGRELQTLSGYDSRHRLASVTHQSCVLSDVVAHTCSTTIGIGSDGYAYDDNDSRTRVNEANGATNLDRYYCYDARDQLATVRSAVGCSTGLLETYTYDDAGNRTSAPGRTFTYSTDGQLTSCTGPTCSLTYDSAGRTATWTEGSVTWSYLYDSEGRLTSGCKASACTGSIDRLDMSYDGEGHRTQLKETTAAGAVTTHDFRYQGAAVVEESVNGVLTRSYVVDEAGAPVKVCLPDCATATYLPTWSGHGDLLALWRVNADGTLTLANSVTYDTWGRPTLSTHNGYADLGVRLLYVGRSDVWWDDAFGAGLLYMHARHYSPTLGRFLQPDPADAEGNLYGYAGNSPTTRVDPAGNYQCLLAGLAGPEAILAACAIEIVALGLFAYVVGQNAVNMVRYCDRHGCSIRSVQTRPYVCYGRGCGYLQTNAGAAQRDIERGHAPKGIERVDKKTNYPGSQDEVHVNGGAIQRDGAIKHRLKAPLTRAQKEWMGKWGFKVPAQYR